MKKFDSDRYPLDSILRDINPKVALDGQRGFRDAIKLLRNGLPAKPINAPRLSMFGHDLGIDQISLYCWKMPIVQKRSEMDVNPELVWQLFGNKPHPTK